MRIWLLGCLLFPALSLTGQNLVFNPSFEEVAACPPSYNLLGPSGWVRSNSSTPDFYHSCSTLPEFSVPYNWNGYSPPHSGHGYMGIIVLSDASFFDMEHINGKLTEALIKDSIYHFEFYVRVAKNLSNYFSSCIGIHFSSKPILSNQSLPDNYLQTMMPDFVSADTFIGSDNICDTTWTRIYGIYHARGGERFISIGMFWQDEPRLVEYVNRVRREQFKQSVVKKGKKLIRKQYLKKNPYHSTNVGHLGQSFAYYFIDDVSVILAPRSR